jgi:outer membrane protein OmpA-like peptidoglycan-associated protein
LMRRAHAIILVLLALTAASWFFAWQTGPRSRPHLVVAATEDLAANHKIEAADVSFAFQRQPRANGTVEWPQEAVGACTRVPIQSDRPIKRRDLIPTDAGGGNCADPRFVFALMQRVLAATPVPGGVTTPARAAAAAALQAFIDVGAGDDPGSRTAMAEFRGEFLKEVATRFAVGFAEALSKGEWSEVPGPKGGAHEIINTIMFVRGSAVMRQGADENLATFIAALRYPQRCTVVIKAYGDNAGSPENDLWLSWNRGRTIVGKLVAGGLQRDQLTILPHGAEDRRSDGDAGVAARADLHAFCP